MPIDEFKLDSPLESSEEWKERMEKTLEDAKDIVWDPEWWLMMSASLSGKSKSLWLDNIMTQEATWEGFAIVDSKEKTIQEGETEEVSTAESQSGELEGALKYAEEIKAKEKAEDEHRFEWWLVKIEWTESEGIDLSDFKIINIEWEFSSADPKVAENMRLGKDDVIIIENQDGKSHYLQIWEDNTLTYRGNSAEQAEEKQNIENKRKEKNTEFILDSEKGELRVDPEWRFNTMTWRLDENGEVTFSSEKKFDEAKNWEDKELWDKYAENTLLWSLVEDKKEIENREKSKSSANEKFDSNAEKNISLIDENLKKMNKGLESSKAKKTSFDDKISLLKEKYNTNFNAKMIADFWKKVETSEKKISELLENAALIKGEFDKNPANKRTTQSMSAIVTAVQQENNTLDETLTEVNSEADKVIADLERRENLTPVTPDVINPNNTTENDPENPEILKNETINKIKGEMEAYRGKGFEELKNDSTFVWMVKDLLATLYPDGVDEIASIELLSGNTDYFPTITKKYVEKFQWDIKGNVDGFFGSDTIEALIGYDFGWEEWGENANNEWNNSNGEWLPKGWEAAKEEAARLEKERLDALERKEAKEFFEQRKESLQWELVTLQFNDYNIDTNETSVIASHPNWEEEIILKIYDDTYDYSMENTWNWIFELKNGKIEYKKSANVIADAEVWKDDTKFANYREGLWKTIQHKLGIWIPWWGLFQTDSKMEKIMKEIMQDDALHDPVVYTYILDKAYWGDLDWTREESWITILNDARKNNKVWDMFDLYWEKNGKNLFHKTYAEYGDRISYTDDVMPSLEDIAFLRPVQVKQSIVDNQLINMSDKVYANASVTKDVQEVTDSEGNKKEVTTLS